MGDNSKIADNSYFMLVNGRTLKNTIKPNKKARFETAPSGTKYQGNYDFGKYRLLFIDGKAWYRDTSIEGSGYIQVANFSMSSSVDLIYACLVPASTINYPRALIDEDSTAYGVQYASQPLAPSPSAVIVMDGVTQPWIILGTGQARITKNYSDWSQDDREYVPVGTRPVYANGVLYMLAKDGNTILRSVSGRPLDFMVVIDAEGNKLPSELDGGAARVGYSVDFDQVISLGRCLTPGALLVGTYRGLYQISFDRSVLPFGEPIFKTDYAWEFPVSGPFCSIVGKTDTYIIGQEGITCLNDLQNGIQDNLGISSPILGLFEGVTQTSFVGGVNFKQYVLFLCDTILGRTIIAYNRVLGIWEAYDLPTGFEGQIKQLSVSRDGVNQRVFAITEYNESLELYGSDEVDICRFYAYDLASQAQNQQLTLEFVYGIFKSLSQEGSVGITMYNDEVPSNAVIEKETTNTTLENLAIRANYQAIGGKVVQPGACRGYRVGAEIAFDCDAELTSVVYGWKANTISVAPIQQASAVK